jgi:hypothetical protein
MKPENKSGKRKEDSGNFTRRATGGAVVLFPFPDFSVCCRRPVYGFNFRFSLSAIRFCP